MAPLSAASLYIFPPMGFTPSSSSCKMSQFLWFSGRISLTCSTLAFRVFQQNWAPVIHNSSWLNKAHYHWLLSLPLSHLDNPHRMFPAPPKLHSNHCLGICFLGVLLQNTVGVQETFIYSSKPLSSSTFWNLLRLFCALIFSMWSIFMSISWAVGKNVYTLFSGSSWIYIDQFCFKLCYLDLSYAFWLFF